MKVKTEKIILEFLKKRLEVGVDTVSSHHFSYDVVKYGELFWRRIRSDKLYTQIDVTDVQSVKHKGAEGKWRLIQDT